MSTKKLGRLGRGYRRECGDIFEDLVLSQEKKMCAVLELFDRYWEER